MATKPISIEITGDAKKFKKATGEVEGKLAGLGKKAALAGTAIAGGLAAGAAALFAIGQDFDAMEATIVKGTGASGDALDGLVESAKAVMTEVPDSGALVSQVLADVNTFFGSTGDELEGLSEGILDFSRLTGVDASTAVGNLDAAMTQFGVGVEDADEVMGDFLRISQATGVPMEKLLSQMETFGPLFRNAGFSLEETTAVFGQLEQAGVNVTRVGPALNKFFRDAAAEGEDPRKALEEVQKAMQAAGSETEALNIATEAFGAEGAQRMTTAIRSGALSFTDLNSLMGEGAGLVDDQTAATETFSDRWNTFKNKVLVKLEPLATKLFDAIEKGMIWIERSGIPTVEMLVVKFRAFSDWIRANKDYIIGALSALAVLVVVTLGPAFVAWAVAAGAAAIATIAALAPIIAITAAVAALGVGIVWLWKNWDKVWAKIKEITGTVVGWVSNKISTGWDAVKGFFSGLKDRAVSIFQSMKSALETKASELVSSVVGFISSIPQKVRDLGTSFLNAGKSVGSKILSGIRDGLTAAVGFAGDVASGVWRAVRNAVNSNVVDKINRNIPNEISLGPLGSIDLPDNPVPRLFKGANSFPGGFAMVGEMGRELVALPGGSRVLNNRETEAAMGGARNTTINVSVESNADPHEIARTLAWAFRTSGK